MKVSIITVCYNSENTIEDTLLSVINQDYPNIEYIVVEGASTDNTLSIIKKYSAEITKIISEKDQGIYDALNKGIDQANGDVIGILHSDDVYANSNIISKVVKEFQSKKSDAVYGDLQYIGNKNPGKIFRTWVAKEYKEGMFIKGWMPPHPTFFVKKAFYDKYGKFNTSLKTAADYELMLRFIHKFKISLSYISEVLVRMRIGGKSNAGLLNRIKANIEDRKAWKINGLKPGFFTLYLKPLSKIKQFFT